MSGIKNCKIRETLKSVFLQYSEIKDFIFTTYDFDIDFFEEHIISYLMDSKRKITTVDDLNIANEWVATNHISIYYDKDALFPGKSSLTVPVYPQSIMKKGKKYVFHPKVIVIYGILANSNIESVSLFVSSCNLTVSGYGRNQEAFACVQVNNKSIAQSLNGFINAISNRDKQRHKELNNFLSTINDTKDDGTVFFWNYNNDKNLINYLANFYHGELQIVSPYFDEKGPQYLLSRLKNATKKIIYPAAEISSGKYNLYLDSYEQLKETVNFREVNHDDDRFVHAKIISIGNRTVVGSYNFTTAAMEGGNAEAALILNRKIILDSQDVEEKKFLIKENGERITNKDERHFDDNIFVLVTVDWIKETIIIEGEDFGTNENYSINLKTGNNEVVIYEKLSKSNSKASIPLNNSFSEILLKHKGFVVKRGNYRCFEGLINEINWKEARPEIGCNNIYETIREWYWITEDQGGHRKKEVLLNPFEETECKELLGIDTESSDDIFDNYYLVSRSFENMIEQINNLKDETNLEKKKNTIFSIIATKPGCILKMISFLSTTSFEDIIYKYLIIKYIDLVLLKIKKEYMKILDNVELNKLREAERIHSELKTNIENELKSFMNNEKSLSFLIWFNETFMERNDV